MLRHKNIDRICAVILALTLLVTGLLLGGVAAGVVKADTTMGYEQRLFDQSRVHTLDIVMTDWDGFVASCANEEYASCSVVIDGEAYKNVAIRGKGNTSLSSVAAYGNNRYSFKIEFDHYQDGRTYYGLDKLCLNNVIQDTTYMKDYWAYTLMNRMGVASPLCSFVQISVNGEPWGLYLAVEGVEDGFMQRNYGGHTGEMYKPDSLSMGGGRGNGKGFDMEAVRSQWDNSSSDTETTSDKQGFTMPGGFTLPEGFTPPGGDFTMPSGDFTLPEGFTPPDGMSMPDDAGEADGASGNGRMNFGGMMGGFGMGSSDVKLQYIDDNPSSYSNIFNNAKTDITTSDAQRLIASLKALSEGDTSVVDTDSVIRYMAVHNFLCNSDSYTGSMVHNYYLYEENGVLSMIPWDYNLAFGTMMGGMNGATSTVNSPIDDLVSSGSVSDRPMADWITSSEENMGRYHEIYDELIRDTFESGWFAEEYARVSAMIDPYVKADPTAFYTYEEHVTGVEVMKAFCEKRALSIRGQLDGTIPATSSGQRSSDSLIDASELTLNDMGSMNNGGFGGRGGDMPSMPGGDAGGFGGSRGGRSNAQSVSTAPSDSVSSASVTTQTGGAGNAPAGNMPAGAMSTGDMPAGMPQGGSQGDAADFAGSQGASAGAPSAPNGTQDGVKMSGERPTEAPTETPIKAGGEVPAAATTPDAAQGSRGSGGSSGDQAGEQQNPSQDMKPMNPMAPGGSGSGSAEAPANDGWVTLAVCVAVLAAGWVTAACFKEHNR